MAQATVYQKHMALQIRKKKYNACHLPGAGRLRRDVRGLPQSIELKPQ